MTTDPLIVGDDVTVVYRDVVTGVTGELRRDRVARVTASQFQTAFTNRMYDVADESITWIRGFHEINAEPLHSLLAYLMMEPA